MTDLRDACFDTIYELALRDPQVVFLTADMGAFGLIRARRELPQRFVNIGISEQAMISIAAGLALEGKKVFVYSITPFVTMRCYEQIKVDLCSMDLGVVIIGIGAGLTYGGDGPTHHAVNDLACLRSLPNMRILGPCDVSSTRRAVYTAYESQGPTFIRIERGQLPDVYLTDQVVGSGVKIVSSGTGVALVSTGYMTPRALAAAEHLKLQGISVRVVDVWVVSPLDCDGLQECLKGVRLTVTLEEHVINGGLGTAVAEMMADRGITAPLLRLALPQTLAYEVADRDTLLSRAGLDLPGITDQIYKSWQKINTEGE